MDEQIRFARLWRKKAELAALEADGRGTHEIAKKLRRAINRAEKEQAMRDLGLTKVRGALGGTYWE